MPVNAPTIEELARIAEAFGLNVTGEDLESYRGLMLSSVESYRRLDEMTEPLLQVKYPRTPGRRPKPEENRLGAWYWRCDIEGAPKGPLSGKSVVLKDNICVAGVPMMNGANVLEGYVPDIDATVVTRVLDAGGTIAGKAVCESLCFSCASHTADTGPVRNPHNPELSAGGSSSGCAVLVATGEADMAIGCDQGGSIRMPSGWCGIYGLKPTYGLVPYTGVYNLELTLDHAGPMARTAADVALLLEAIAGPDGMDPRQHAGAQTDAYTRALTGKMSDLRVAAIEEGFGWQPYSEEDVDEVVMAGVHKFEKLGVNVGSVSIPWHREATHVFTPIVAEGSASTMMDGNGMGNNWIGYYTTSLQDAFARGWKSRPDDLSETTKVFAMMGKLMREKYHGHYYAKAQNLRRTLMAAYDEALREYDLLVLPTLLRKPTPLPGPDASREEIVTRAFETNYNTSPFNMTGNPAMNVPCGEIDGMPVGMMLVGRRGEDATVLRAADAYERGVGG